MPPRPHDQVRRLRFKRCHPGVRLPHVRQVVPPGVRAEGGVFIDAGRVLSLPVALEEKDGGSESGENGGSGGRPCGSCLGGARPSSRPAQLAGCRRGGGRSGGGQCGGARRARCTAAATAATATRTRCAGRTRAGGASHPGAAVGDGGQGGGNRGGAGGVIKDSRVPVFCGCEGRAGCVSFRASEQRHSDDVAVFSPSRRPPGLPCFPTPCQRKHRAQG